MTALELQVRKWIKQNTQENGRLEFKQRVELASVGARAEFVRDVIALANSEGEFPRSDGHLVIGFRDGKCHDIGSEGYDGAKFGQILDALISPPVSISYEEFGNGRRGRIGVLIIKPDPDVLYIVHKDLRENAHVHLQAGQSWGRRSARKIDLDGSKMQTRLAGITERKIADATTPLFERITKLEYESGPALEVKRIRFEMDRRPDWPELESLLEKLLPYATEFDHPVKHEVLDAVRIATARVRSGMTVDVFRAVDSVLEALMPVGSGGVSRKSREGISIDDERLLKRIEDAAFELAWDACRYVRDIHMVDIAAHRYWYLIRIVALNCCERLEEKFLKNIRDCQKICEEERAGVPFVEARKLLEARISDALNRP
jgi:hypothetical protein